MSVQVATELDYSEKVVAGGSTYKFQRIAPQESSSLTGAVNGSTKCTFILNDVCMNLSKSIISFIWGHPAVAAKFLHLHTGGIPHIENITISTASGVILAYIPQLGNFSRMIMPYTTSLKKFLSKSVNQAKASAVLSVDEMGDMFHRSDVLKSTVPAGDGTATAKYIQYDLTQRAGDLSYTGPCEVLVCAQGVAGYVKVQLNLGEIIHTLFAVNKSLVFGQKLTIALDLQQGNKIGFSADDVAGANPVDIASAPVISSMFLYLAVEQNATVAAALRDKVNSGLTMSVPYVYYQKLPLQASQVNSTRFTFMKNKGQKLRRIYSGIFRGGETGVAAFLRGNEDAGICSYIRSSFMSVFRQDYDMKISDGEPYMALKDMISDSTIQSATDYQHRFTWIDDWTGLKTSEGENKEDWDSGIEIQNDSDYNLLLTTTSAITNHNVFQYAVVQRTLSIANETITLI